MLLFDAADVQLSKFCKSNLRIMACLQLQSPLDPQQYCNSSALKEKLNFLRDLKGTY